MAKKYFWFKMKDNFFQSKELKKLRKIAGGDTFTIIYLKMIMLSTKTEGRLQFDGVEDTFSEELALELDEDIDNVKMTLAFLNKCGLIEMVSDDEYVLPEAMANIGSESESAERVRLHREKKAQLALHCNGHVTNCNTEIEKDLDLKKEIYKPSHFQDDRCAWYFDMYRQVTGENHRTLKVDIQWNSTLDDLEEEEFKALAYNHIRLFMSDPDRRTVEYFNAVSDRYR